MLKKAAEFLIGFFVLLICLFVMGQLMNYLPVEVAVVIGCAITAAAGFALRHRLRA
jgi:hypothetical protein